MSSYVTRAERAGSIFFRVTGLIRSGHIDWADRPLWYDVMVAQPPLTNPVWNVQLPRHDEPVRRLFYREDNIRAEFYKKHRSVGAINTERDGESIAQQFINEYKAIEKESLADGIPLTAEQIFARTEERLSVAGVNLDRQAKPKRESSSS